MLAQRTVHSVYSCRENRISPKPALLKTRLGFLNDQRWFRKSRGSPANAANGRSVAALETISIKMKVDDDIHLDRNRTPVHLGGFEAPGLHGFHCFLIQAHAERTHYCEAFRKPICPDRR